MRDFKFTEQERPTMANFNARFDAIAALANGLGNEYVWEKREEYYDITESIVINLSYLMLFKGTSASKTGSLLYSDSVKVENGEIVLNDPKTLTVSYNTYTNLDALIGKYVIADSSADSPYGGTLYHIKSGSVWRNYGGGLYWVGFNNSPEIYTLSAVEKYSVFGYVNSPDPSDYPPAESDGYTYTALGQLGSKVRIATGSYVGTGTYGASNPNSLTFEFVPKIVIIQQKDSVSYGGFPWQYGTDVAKPYISSGTGVAVLSWKWNTVYWYNETNETYQLNSSGVTYCYVAIG